MKDLTLIPECKAVGPQLLPIIQNITKYDLHELKSLLRAILYDPKTSISKEKAAKYVTFLNSIYDLKHMQMFVTNIYLASANMSLTRKKR